MSSPASSSEINPFILLDPGIQRWIWGREWKTLRPIQEQAIPALLPGDRDVILAAATSAGKTEAAFFPILTRLLQEEDRGIILAISPLKALINDQADRLRDLCESLDIPVIGWHGDGSQSRKQKFLRELRGVLIITPESLEALFVNKGTAIPALASRTRYIVIDELHAFIGTERGKQVQSLLQRTELAGGRTIPRVGLSATLGDMALAADFLRPGKATEVKTIDAGSEGSTLRLVVKAFVDRPMPVPLEEDQTKEQGLDATQDVSTALQDEYSAKYAIAQYLYRELRGSNHLVFPNSRADVEYYADGLRRRCERDNAPNEFWAHHGNLSREYREDAEQALKSGEHAATAICTTTLELGIDIGNVKSVAQIGPPPSVASLRQRMGRSGRRAGEPTILRCLCIERLVDEHSEISDKLHESLLQTTAMVRLMLNRWVEPPRPHALHASTLVQQILSIIAEKGGATAGDLWKTLVQSGTFQQVERTDLLAILRELGRRELLSQESSGLLLPGALGERLINRYDFYAAFTASEEFRLEADGRALGSLPVLKPLIVGQRIIFAGRRWRVLNVDTEHKAVRVTFDPGGVPPMFEGGSGMVHDRVRSEMKAILAETEAPPFLDAQARDLIREAQNFYRNANLEERRLFSSGKKQLLFTWAGDWINDALVLLFNAQGLSTQNDGLYLTIEAHDGEVVVDAMENLACLAATELTSLDLEAERTMREKWDWALPEGVRSKSFASAFLDIHGALAFSRHIGSTLQG